MQYTSLLIFLTSFIVSWIAIPSIIKVAKEKSLYDKPNETRKIHTKCIPNLGGVAIFLGFYFSTLMFRVLCDSVEVSALCAASVLLFFVALKDDLISTAPKLRLFYQFVIALIIILVGQVYFSHLPFYESEGVFLKIINMVVSLFFIVAMINAVNFIDGIDGLAGSVSLLIFLLFGAVFFQYNEYSYAFISLALAGSTLGFLLFNLHPAKIFMGDIGSMLLGIFMAVMAIKLSNMEPLRLGYLPIKNPSCLAFALLIIPIMDMLTVVIIRMSLGVSPLKADKRHTHHRLLALGFGHHAITLTLLGFNILAVVVYFLASMFMNSFLTGLTLLIFCGLFEIGLYKIYEKNEQTKAMLEEN